MTTTTLYMDRICPYAQRARITLEEKQVPMFSNKCSSATKVRNSLRFMGKLLVTTLLRLEECLLSLMEIRFSLRAKLSPGTLPRNMKQEINSFHKIPIKEL